MRERLAFVRVLKEELGQPESSTARVVAAYEALVDGEACWLFLTNVVQACDCANIIPRPWLSLRTILLHSHTLLQSS